MNILSCSDVTFGYEEARQILSTVSFSIGEGETVGLVGANGAGKSTLLKLILGLLPVQRGQILVEDIPVVKKNYPKVREKVGYVFQDADSQLFMSTAYEDVAFAPQNYGFSKEEVEKRALHALEQTGSLYLKDKPVYQMSGGEKRLISIATILSMEPELIIMDEPEVSLDPFNRRRLIGILQSLSGAKLVASHDLDLIYETCERTILLSEGQIVADGPTQQVLTDRALLEAHHLELPLKLQ